MRFSDRYWNAKMCRTLEAHGYIRYTNSFNDLLRYVLETSSSETVVSFSVENKWMLINSSEIITETPKGLFIKLCQYLTQTKSKTSFELFYDNQNEN